MSDLHLEEAIEELKAATKICPDCKGPLERVLTVLVNGKPKKEKTYRIGQKVRIGRGNYNPYLLVTHDTVCVFAVGNHGSRWHDPERVKSVSAITEAEMEKICGRRLGTSDWSLIEEDE